MSPLCLSNKYVSNEQVPHLLTQGWPTAFIRFWGQKGLGNLCLLVGTLTSREGRASWRKYSNVSLEARGELWGVEEA